MASSNQGIQTLLDAERESQRIVEEARQYRIKRVKDAEKEAQAEIEQYRKMKEQDFVKFSQSREGTTQTSQTSIDQDTEKKLEEITRQYNEKREEEVNKLIERVVLVKAELHRNLKKSSVSGNESE